MQFNMIERYTNKDHLKRHPEVRH